MHKYSFIIIHLNYGLFSVKNQDKSKPSIIKYNITENNKMNEIKKNNEHK